MTYYDSDKKKDVTFCRNDDGGYKKKDVTFCRNDKREKGENWTEPKFCRNDDAIKHKYNDQRHKPPTPIDEELLDDDPPISHHRTPLGSYRDSNGHRHYEVGDTNHACDSSLDSDHPPRSMRPSCSPSCRNRYDDDD